MVDPKAIIGDVTLVEFVFFIFLFWITVIFSNLISTFITRFLRTKTKKPTYKVPGKVIQYILIFSATYYGLKYILGFDLTAFAAAFGVIGIAVAFSAQQTIQNLIAGIFIIVGGTIKLGDWVEVSGFPRTGLSQVKDISITRTTLREDNGRLIIVPNSIFIENKIIKYPEGDFFKEEFSLLVSSKNNLKKVKKIIQEVCNKNEKVLPNIPRKEKYGLRKILNTVPEEHRDLFQFLRRRIDTSRFEPVVFVDNISKNSIKLNVLLWVWEIRNRDKIVSSIMEELLEEFSKNKIELV